LYAESELFFPPAGRLLTHKTDSHVRPNKRPPRARAQETSRRGAMSDTGKKTFRLEEATIDEMHAAIKAGEITCVQIVQHYIDRAKAYNGVASVLVTEDGAPVKPGPGAVRAGAPLEF